VSARSCVSVGDALTTREELVLVMFADGMTSSDIAAELYLSVETVRSHAGALLGKLGAKNRAHAVALGYHRGLLRPMVAA
jgi:DNA-binding NarL/FixJ family response regulator